MLLERIGHFTPDDLDDVALNDERERFGFELDLLIARVEMEIVDGDDGAHDGCQKADEDDANEHFVGLETRRHHFVDERRGE